MRLNGLRSPWLLNHEVNRVDKPNTERSLGEPAGFFQEPVDRGELLDAINRVREGGV